MKVDARGLSCPEPVLLTKKALDKEKKAVVLVDNTTALQNITRFATNAGYSVQQQQIGDDYELTIK